MLPALPIASQAVTSSQQFSDYYGLDSFEFNGEVYVVLINEQSTKLMKFDTSKKILIPADFFTKEQQLIQYKSDPTGRLSLVVEEKGRLSAILLGDSTRIEIKLPELEHKGFKHSLCCADILRVGGSLYVWHDRRLMKFDIYASPPAKVFDQLLHFDTANKGNLILRRGRVILNMHDGRLHYFESHSDIFRSEANESFNQNYENYSEETADQARLKWDSSWPSAPFRAEEFFRDDKDRPVMLTESDGIYLLEDSTWKLKTANLAILNYQDAFQLKGGKICLVSARLGDSKNINHRRIIIYDVENNSFDVLTLELGKAFDSPPQDSLR
ncbi:MAG: hypothetical protein SFY67_07885 [Candidatus Melainabacteria bacterium]|nr:hypothetical protein [Candidatus Melainabacteria bacterium]